MKAIIDTFVPLLQGLGRTFAYIFRKKITYQYPEEKREVSERWRGMHRLKTENGQIKCVACGLCEMICPAKVISVERKETEVRSFPVRFEVEVTRCIFCGYCQEACPKDAIELTRNYEMVDYKRQDFHVTRDQLLATESKR